MAMWDIVTNMDLMDWYFFFFIDQVIVFYNQIYKYAYLHVLVLY